MAYICEFLTGDKSLQVGNEQVIRALPFGPFWTKIRVGFSVVFNTNVSLRSPGVYIGQPYGPLYGVCTGIKASHDTDTVDALYSSVFPDGNSYFPVRNAAGYLSISANASGRVWQHVGATKTSVSTTTISNSSRWSTVQNVRTSIFTDIAKASATTVTVTNWSMVSFTDVSPSAFLLALESESSPTSMTSGSGTGTLVRTAKDWNACFFSNLWSVPTININRWAVARFV